MADTEEIVSYTQRMPKHILGHLDREAAELRRSRTEQVNRILEERYRLVKPESTEEQVERIAS
jgi:hypothetical protein